MITSNFTFQVWPKWLKAIFWGFSLVFIFFLLWWFQFERVAILKLIPINLYQYQTEFKVLTSAFQFWVYVLTLETIILISHQKNKRNAVLLSLWYELIALVLILLINYLVINSAGGMRVIGHDTRFYYGTIAQFLAIIITVQAVTALSQQKNRKMAIAFSILHVVFTVVFIVSVGVRMFPPLPQTGGGEPDTPSQVVPILTAATGFLTAASAFYGHFLTNKKIRIDHEIELQRLKIESKKIDLERKKLAAKRKIVKNKPSKAIKK